MSRILSRIISLSVAFTLVSLSSAQTANPPLTLKDAVAQALAKNFTVKIQQYSVSRATDSVIIAQSVYDPSFGVNWQKNV